MKREVDKVRLTFCCCECDCEELYEVDDGYVCCDCGMGQYYGDLVCNGEYLGKEVVEIVESEE